ncbi:MAG TPA: outer membrane beta-barrel protein [Bdellovibrionota bacterium]|nr:outer membrane beta-barrel protein [Bdellovibrionota bacterium]
MFRTIRLIGITGVFFGELFTPSVQAFDVLDRQASYHDSKYITLGAGLGFTGFAFQEGIDGDPGFAFRVSGGHHFNRYLQAEILYEFSTFRFHSPDPIAPTTQLSTRSAMNNEMIRFVLTYPAVLLQPYVSAGIGGYNWIGVNDETALSFPINFSLPLAAGLRAYIYKNLVSMDLDFNYYILFGENQSADTLTLLGLDKVSFDSYAFMTSFTFHFL